MESLAEDTWDLVIAGTGLAQALLALSLSRSGLKILHVDENAYYGGLDSGLSLDEARALTERSTGSSLSPEILQPASSTSTLAQSRAYTLSLNPQIIYAQSTFLPSLVSAQINTQLEFLAVGSWWICKDGKIQKVPSSREDIFADDGLSRRDKIGVMKFLRHVVQDISEESEGVQDQLAGKSLQSALASDFKISSSLQLPISALALTPRPVSDTPVEAAVPRIRRHMRSIGHFGPGFGAVIAKYAGNAEIAQVCCRACAVGGAVYLLGQGVSQVDTSDSDGVGVAATLTSGITVKTRYLVGSATDLPTQVTSTTQTEMPQLTITLRSINIVASPLRHLFPPTSDNGPVPAVAIVCIVDAETDDEALDKTPVYLQIHSEDTGECPAGQCIIYASTTLPGNHDHSTARKNLATAVQRFLEATVNDQSATDDNSPAPELLWTMSYITSGAPFSQPTANPHAQDRSGKVFVFPPRPHDVAFSDDILDSVKSVWQRVLGDAASDAEFLRFEDRSGSVEGDES